MFLLIDNFDSFTFNLVQAFQQLGADPVVLRNDRGELLDPNFVARCERVCLSPGPSRPDNAGNCLKFLELLPKDTPTLGVCLGHQTLGQFAGGSVNRNSRIMHGKTSLVHHDNVGLFQGLPQPFEVCRYHSLVVDPEGSGDLLQITARTAENEVMGLKYSDRPWTGVQFHPESILTPEGPKLLKNFLDGII
ncbi:MAG: aminodeoxychorismate/anthranilate synthase component II [Proteobacteria bacterium]|nr:aminodeoxychorismate/anthranilate synthase component II [Pseudomonadota bacterium]MBU1610982.1 aminodeoxychorismate/anthranilate synthase component II [Pseudomonadota bacterium]